jgi:DNA-binding transcriptional ArsR family regulator
MALGPGVPDPPPANIDHPHSNSRHGCGESYAVRANPILSGLHHEHSLVPVPLRDRISADYRSAAIDTLIAIWLYRYVAIYNSRADRLSSTFHALSDPTRRAILARLVSGEATVSELMEPFQLSQPTISKHLKVLENAGLIEGGRDAQRRPRRLAPLAMKDIADWIESFRQQWESRFNNLDAHLTNIKNREK